MFGGQSKSKAPANQGDQTVQFRRSDAQRIANAVHAYETGIRQANPSRLPRAVVGGGRLRLCKTSAAFNKGTVATLNVWEDGTPPNETQTAGVTVADVVNKFANIASGKWVSVALHGNGRWYVVSAEC